MKTLLLKLSVLTSFILIILFPSVSMNGAISGISLCVRTIFPCLFPAMVISRMMQKIFSSKGSTYFSLLLGILCGFPIGAYFCSSIKKEDPSGTLPDNIMAFCNISSPSFVINYIGLFCLKEISIYKILLIIYLPVIFISIIIIFTDHSHVNNSNNYNTCTPKISSILTESISEAVNCAIGLCGYIVFFSVISSMISQIPINYPIIKSIITGTIEITNGIHECTYINNINIRAITALTINAFGGLSTLMQTIMTTKSSKISIKKYIYYKLILTTVTLLISIPVLYV